MSPELDLQCRAASGWALHKFLVIVINITIIIITYVVKIKMVKIKVKNIAGMAIGPNNRCKMKDAKAQFKRWIVKEIRCTKTELPRDSADSLAQITQKVQL